MKIGVLCDAIINGKVKLVFAGTYEHNVKIDIKPGELQVVEVEEYREADNA